MGSKEAQVDLLHKPVHAEALPCDQAAEAGRRPLRFRRNDPNHPCHLRVPILCQHAGKLNRH